MSESTETPLPTLAPGPSDATDAQPEPELEAVVRCRACSHTVTRQGKAIAMRGAHEHTFRNPAGYSFHVLCYSEAPGAVRVGAPVSEATWFPGYTWCFAICDLCRGHLGWWYTAESADPGGVDPGRFAGLIATRLLRGK